MIRSFGSKNKPIHFIGIGGIGMSGIAEILHRMGFSVTGSDSNDSATTQRLKDLGIKVFKGHEPSNLGQAKVVVYSSAVNEQNPEVIEARSKSIPLVPRAEMLAELMRLQRGIAIAGTHGKTSTTSMAASILAAGGLDPTVIVGGKVGALGGNAKLGASDYLIAEADESDGSFLRLSPILTAVTNIDNDHMDHYKSMDALKNAFIEYINKIPYYGLAVLCADDENISDILGKINKPYLTYGLKQAPKHSKGVVHYQIQNYQGSQNGCSFDLEKNGKHYSKIQLKFPGKHYALNAVAAFALAEELGIPAAQIQKGLLDFSGVGRRFEFKGKITKPEVTIIDDYGHHPTEIKATLEAARNYWGNGRIVVVFQPHRYTRTESCWNQFTECFENADQVLLMDIYPAGEKPITNISSEALCDNMKKKGFKNVSWIGNIDNAILNTKNYLKDGDLLITMGAGTITQLGPKLL